MVNENHRIYVENLGILSDYINNTKNCTFKIYPSGRAISIVFNKIEYKFIIKNGRNSIHMEFVGLANFNSIKPYKPNDTKLEVEFNTEWLENVFDYMQKTVLENKEYYR